MNLILIKINIKMITKYPEPKFLEVPQEFIIFLKNNELGSQSKLMVINNLLHLPNTNYSRFIFADKLWDFPDNSLSKEQKFKLATIARMSFDIEIFKAVFHRSLFRHSLEPGKRYIFLFIENRCQIRYFSFENRKSFFLVVFDDNNHMYSIFLHGEKLNKFVEFCQKITSGLTKPAGPLEKEFNYIHHDFGSDGDIIESFYITYERTINNVETVSVMVNSNRPTYEEAEKEICPKARIVYFSLSQIKCSVDNNGHLASKFIEFASGVVSLG